MQHYYPILQSIKCLNSFMASNMLLYGQCQCKKLLPLCGFYEEEEDHLIEDKQNGKMQSEFQKTHPTSEFVNGGHVLLHLASSLVTVVRQAGRQVDRQNFELWQLKKFNYPDACVFLAFNAVIDAEWSKTIL